MGLVVTTSEILLMKLNNPSNKVRNETEYREFIDGILLHRLLVAILIIHGLDVLSAENNGFKVIFTSYGLLYHCVSIALGNSIGLGELEVRIFLQFYV